MAMTEAVLNAWLKNPGDSVISGEAIAEIETDKSSLDLESPSDGGLGRHLGAGGASVPVGQVIVRVLEPGETEPQDDDNAGPRTAEPAADAEVAGAAAGAGADGVPDDTTRTRPEDRVPHQLSPRKRRELREQAQAAAGQRGSRLRAAIAEPVSGSWRTIPHFAVVREIDARAVNQALAVMRGNGLPATATD